MATLNELCYDILNTIRGGVTSDDEVVTKRQVAFWIKTVRAQLIRQDIEKKRSVSDNVRQVLCVPMELADLSVCCGIQTGCKGLRSKDVIPNPMELHHKDLITRVGPVDALGMSYDYVPYERAVWSAKSGKFRAKDRIKAFLFNHRIHLLVPSDTYLGIKHVSVHGVFENPEDAGVYVCDGSPCFSEDGAYPVSSWMIPVIKQLVIEQSAKYIVGAPQDVVNNAKNDLSTQANGATQAQRTKQVQN
jgi:hypothetical protein